jgi:hypothetical protein
MTQITPCRHHNKGRSGKEFRCYVNRQIQKSRKIIPEQNSPFLGGMTLAEKKRLLSEKNL